MLGHATTAWLAFTHPKVARVHATAWLDGQLVVTVDDDRGPAYHDAAAVLADMPVEREGWAVAQLITIADGLAAMAAHQPGSSIAGFWVGICAVGSSFAWAALSVKYMKLLWMPD